MPGHLPGMGRELEPELDCRSYKIVVDTIEVCKTTGDIAYLMNHDLLKEDQIYADLYEIAKRMKKGGEDDLEIIIIVSQS